MNEPRVKTWLSQFVSMNGQALNVLAKVRYEAVGRRGMYKGRGAGRHNQNQDNAEMHDLFVTPARVYYLLVGPRLAEAHDTSTVEPLTGSARFAPKPLTISNLLHSQHLSDDQHKDVVNDHLVKTRPTQFDFMNGHTLNVLPKCRYKAKGAGCRGMHEGGGAGQCGMYEAEGVGRQGMHEAGGAGRESKHEGGGAGRHDQDQDTSDTIGAGHLDGEDRGREVQGHDNVVGMNKAEGAGRHGTYEAEGAGCQGMHKATGQATEHDHNENRDRKITKNTFLNDSCRRQGMYEASGQATELNLNEYEDRKMTKNTCLDDSCRKNQESDRRYGKPKQGGARRQGTYEARGAGVRARMRQGARGIRKSRARTRMGALGGRTPGRPPTSTRPGPSRPTSTRPGPSRASRTKRMGVRGGRTPGHPPTSTRPGPSRPTSTRPGPSRASRTTRMGARGGRTPGSLPTSTRLGPSRPMSTRPGLRPGSRSQGGCGGDDREDGNMMDVYYRRLVQMILPNSPRDSKVLMSWRLTNLCCFRVPVLYLRTIPDRLERQWPRQDG